MALNACHECGRQISDQAPACPGCGAPVKQPERRTGLDRNVGAGTVLIALLAVGFVFVWILVAINPEPKAERDARYKDGEAISRCEDDYARANDDRRYSPGELEIIHGACEHLKAEYRQKWGREP